MRDIKFRLWNGVPREPSQSRYFYDFPNVFDCLKQQLICNDNSESLLGYNHIGDGSAFEQYTGLKDKNGVDIFEGDIVKTDDKLIFEVKWDDEWCGFNLIVDARPIEVFPYDSEMIEVIGNIHQSPELL